jgi:4-hydroxy-4-methyl-2-oxoglutarate aldolase
VGLQCGGVVVHPGDVVRADRNGVVVVPVAALPEVLERTRVVARSEEEWRAGFATGAGVGEVLGVDALIAHQSGSHPTEVP